MLRRISLKNFVLFDRLELDLTNGFTVISGETGAGKSLLIDAIGLGLGARSQENPVRKGADLTSISLIFDHPESAEIQAFFDDYALESQLESQSEIHLRRVIQKSGQSKAFINDQPVTLATLKLLGEMLLDSVGQFSTQSLLNPQTHLTYLDRFGQLEDKTAKVTESYDVWHKITSDIKAIEEDMLLVRRDQDYYAHALDELDKVAPEPQEESQLIEKRTAMMQSQRTHDACESALQRLVDPKTLDSLIFGAQRDLQKVADANTPEMNKLIDQLEHMGSEARDIIESLKDLHFSLSGGSRTLEDLDDRLHLIKGLARKYQTQGDMLHEYWVGLQEKASSTETREKELATKKIEADKAFQSYKKLAIELDALRKKQASKITQAVLDLLPSLKLDKARFVMEVTSLAPESGTRTGINTTQMRVSMNPGSELADIHKVASGGELSRFLLVLSSICTFNTKTILFDEIDTGVGGAVASAMGSHLKKMSQQQQVITLTHAPQIAALADTHFRVEKNQQEETLAHVTRLDKENHAEEIARMLSGESVTDAARKAALSLMTAAKHAA